MTVWAGLDIGNASTEIVLCRDRRHEGVELLDSARTMTRGDKGSVTAMEGAARVARRLAEANAVVIERVAFAPTPPVVATVDRTDGERPRTGRLRVVTRSAATTAGNGTGVGAPVHVRDLRTGAPEQSVIVCAPRDCGYREVASVVNAALGDGVEVRGVIAANDEAVLISNRLTRDLPVIDDVDVPGLLSVPCLALEVRQSGGLTKVTDPFWLTSALDLGSGDQPHARVVAGQLRDSALAIIALDADAESAEPHSEVPRGRPLPEGTVHTVALSEVADHAGVRRGSVEVDCAVTARMSDEGAPLAGSDELQEMLGAPVTQIVSESAAAQVGAGSTPGVVGDVVVVDVGGGTVDVVLGESRVVLPGAGQMLTTLTASALEISRSAAEYAKRGEAVKSISSQLTEDEHGRRVFLDVPVDGRSVGWLLARSPGGWLPFTSRLGTTEWRNWRHVAKQRVIGANVLAGVARVDAPFSGVLLVGGAAGDDELVRAVSEELGEEVTVGRGNIAGTLGHRFAVAYGLVVMGVRGG